MTDIGLTTKFLTVPLQGEERDRFNEGDRAIIVCVALDGSLSADDELKPIGYGNNLGNVASTTLAEFLQHPQVLHHKVIQSRVPAERVVHVLEAAAQALGIAPDAWFTEHCAGAMAGSQRDIWLSERA